MTQVADPTRAVPPAGQDDIPGDRTLPNGPDLPVPLVLRLPNNWPLDEDQFVALCRENESLRIERNAGGDLEIMRSTGGGTGNRNFRLAGLFDRWVEQDGTGEGFDSSTRFRLPNGAERGPDLAWVRRERLEELTVEEAERFLPLCPDFVLELRSPTDRLAPLQAKMQEWLDNGAQLGWLIDPQNRRIYVYRAGATVEMLEDPATLSGEPVLPGFVLDVQAIFKRRIGRER